MEKHIGPQVLVVIITMILGVIVIALFPWKTFHWGNVSLQSSRSVTVVGSAKSEEQNQIATFTGGVNAVNDNRDAAINDVNTKIQRVTDAVKALGVAESDIKTQNMNIFQSEEQYYEDGRQKTRLGQWRVSNTIEVKLRDITKSDALAAAFTAAGANNVWGPNFSLDDTEEAEKQLLAKAIEKAREKAELVAQAAGRKLGDIITVSESATAGVFPMFDRGGGGGGGAYQPGTGTVQKDVTVTFELK